MLHASQTAPTRTGNRSIPNATPPANIIERTDAFVVALAVPGRQKSDIRIELNKLMLTVSAPALTQTENQRFMRQEFGSAPIERKFTLPNSVDVEKIEATVENGILTMTLPKKSEVQPRQISIL
jgi:HSP20 family protein